MNPIVPRLALAATLTLVAAGASGCASLVPEPAEGAVTQPAAAVDDPYPVDAAWLLDGQLIAFVTWGSSSCHPVVKSVTATGDARIDVAFDRPTQNRFCTLDYSPRVGSIRTPGDIDPAKTVQLRITMEDGETVHTVRIMPELTTVLAPAS